jgi:micrococcal nuclease
MNRCFAIALSILTLTCGALAEPISVTNATVVDGDTIDAHGQRYRMIGYDTPEVVTPAAGWVPMKERWQRVPKSGL